MTPSAAVCPAMTYYAPPAEPARPRWRRRAALLGVATLHALVLLAIARLAIRPEPVSVPQALSMRLLELAPTPPRIEPPKAKSPSAASARKAPVAAPPLITAAPTAAATASFTVAAQPEPRPVDVHVAPPAPPEPPPIIAARFDADYLQNPKPFYPPMSRRQGEEGKVVLRVRVSAQGTSLAVDIKQSSGYPRLDAAARAAVEKWRFVAARQGSDAVESTVLVPLSFTLDN